MFDGNNHNGKCGRLFKFRFNVSDGIAKCRSPIRQKSLHSIVRNNDDSYVDAAFLAAVPQMNNVSDQEVATSGNLNLYAQLRNKCSIYAQLLRPIDSASFSLSPAFSLPEGGVERFSDRSCAIGFDLSSSDMTVLKISS